MAIEKTARKQLAKIGTYWKSEGETIYAKRSGKVIMAIDFEEDGSCVAYFPKFD